MYDISIVKMRRRADSRPAPSQWETSLQSNAVSHWLGANLEATLRRFWDRLISIKVIHTLVQQCLYIETVPGYLVPCHVVQSLQHIWRSDTRPWSLWVPDPQTCCRAHYDDVIMGTMASQITCLTIVYSALYSGADQRKHQSSASLAFVRGIHRGPVNSPHKWPVTRKMFPFDDVIMLGLKITPTNGSPIGKWIESFGN